MGLKLRRWFAPLAVGLLSMNIVADQAQAYLYWMRPDFTGPEVRGDEPGITLPMPGAKPDEIQANLVWTLRAALNVAALQCQFATPLRTVPNYNTLLSQHSAELTKAHGTVSAYFKRTQGKNWQRAFDQHTTRIYNGMSTMQAQIGFCETAGKIGRLALAERRGQLYKVAQTSMSEIRNSLIPMGDRMFSARPLLTYNISYPSLDASCWDKRGTLKKKCWPKT